MEKKKVKKRASSGAAKRPSTNKGEVSISVPKDVALVSVFVIGMLCMAAIIYMVMEPEAVNRAASLDVEEVYFLMEGENESRTMEISAFITNDGGSDADLEVRAFVIDDGTNIAVAEASDDMGSIDAQTTAETTLSIDVEDDDKYTIELVVLQDGKIALKGRGTVDLRPGDPIYHNESKYGSGYDYSTTYRSPDLIADEDSAGGGSPAKGLSLSEEGGAGTAILLIFIVVPIVVIIAVIRRRYR